MRDEAFLLDHDHTGTEHLLLALVRVNDGITSPVFDRFAITYERLRKAVNIVTPDVDVDAEHTVLTIRAPSPDQGSQSDAPPVLVDNVASPREFTPELLRCLMTLDQIEAEALGDRHVGPEHLLLAVLRQHQDVAGEALGRLGIDAEECRRSLLERIADAPGANDATAPKATEEDHEAELQMRADLARARMSPEDRVVFTSTQAAHISCVLSGLSDYLSPPRQAGDTNSIEGAKAYLESLPQEQRTAEVWASLVESLKGPLPPPGSELVIGAIHEAFLRRSPNGDDGKLTEDNVRQIIESIVSYLARTALDQLGK